MRVCDVGMRAARLTELGTLVDGGLERRELHVARHRQHVVAVARHQVELAQVRLIPDNCTWTWETNNIKPFGRAPHTSSH